MACHEKSLRILWAEPNAATLTPAFGHLHLTGNESG
jgi:hypothetical protein